VNGERRVLGIDVGAHGAIALVAGSKLLDVHDMPAIKVTKAGGKGSRTEISEGHLAQLIRELSPDVAWIERVGAMPKQGVASTFQFGIAYGIARGIVAALGVPTILVTPVQWKREFHLRADKQQARLLASRLFPDMADRFARIRDDGRAEAALIASFGARYAL